MTLPKTWKHFASVIQTTLGDSSSCLTVPELGHRRGELSDHEDCGLVGQPSPLTHKVLHVYSPLKRELTKGKCPRPKTLRSMGQVLGSVHLYQAICTGWFGVNFTQDRVITEKRSSGEEMPP